MKINDFPVSFQAADAASLIEQRKFNWVLGLNLFCYVIAAILSVINSGDTYFSIFQTIVLLFGLGFSIYLSSKKPQCIWYGTRALAESIKTISWRYMMKAEPFDGEDNTADSNFISSLRKILDSNKTFSSYAMITSEGEQITEKMKEVRENTLLERKKIYKAQRIEEQQVWYQNKAKSNRQCAVFWFGVLIVVNALAILFSITKQVSPYKNYWPTDILVVIAGSILTWIQMKRYQELTASYTLTTHEISLLKAEFPDDKDEKHFSVFVSDTENAFSREHTQWQARRDTN